VTVEVAVGVPGLSLPGTVTLPAGAGPFPAVILIAGSGPNDRDETFGPNKPFKDWSDGLAARGVASLRYDKRTLVNRAQLARRLSTFTPTEEYVTDALAAVDLLRSRPEIDRRRVFVAGHSQGGTFAPKIVTTQPAVAGMVLLAGGSEPFGATLVRQTMFLATHNDASGQPVEAQLAAVRRQAALIDDPNLTPTTPGADLPGGLSPPYWLDLTHYNEIATARALPQPILLMQGDRDYQVTVTDDLSAWVQGLGGKPNVGVKEYPRADHLFLDGDGPPSPAEYNVPGHVDPTSSLIGEPRSADHPGCPSRGRRGQDRRSPTRR
jgi:dienelactone hydrolase